MIVLVGILIGGGIYWLFFRGPSSAECAPVREFLAYNKTEVDALNAKTHIPEEGSYGSATTPSELDYRTWVDGLTDRAAKVTDPELAGQTKAAVETAERLVRAQVDFDAQSQKIAPGAPLPPSGMLVVAFNEQYQAQISQLAATCSG